MTWPAGAPVVASMARLIWLNRGGQMQFDRAYFDAIRGVLGRAHYRRWSWRWMRRQCRCGEIWPCCVLKRALVAVDRQQYTRRSI
jgi:hypothetical protein